MSPSRPNNWEYFAAVETDLANCERFVEFNQDNFGTYSNEFAKILVTAGSEIDTVLRRVCKVIDPSKSPKTILDYQPIVLSKYPQLLQSNVLVRHKRLTLKPWETWTQTVSPPWWKDGFNVVKHDRTNNFAAASLGNALNSVGALLLVVICCHHAETGAPVSVDLNRGTKLFTPAMQPDDFSGAYMVYSI